MRLAILGLSVLLSLAAVEAVFRYRAWQLDYQSLEGAFARQAETSTSGRTRFIDVIQPNANERIIYELRPNLKTEFAGQPMSTNSAGFRMPEFSREKKPGMITILGLGGSIMFGHGVADGEDFFSVMAAQLRSGLPERTWRCINTAVPSYNVVMKVETLKEKGLQYEPDLVVLGIASNNLDLPNYIRVADDPFDFKKSFIFDFLDELRGLKREESERIDELALVDHPKLSWGAVAVTAPNKIPERYRGLVGWRPFYAAMDELKALSEKHGFEVVVIANLDVDLAAQMLEAAKERGFEVVLTRDEIETYFQDVRHEPFSMERYCQSDLVVSTENLHPSVIQQRLMGRRLAQELWKRGIVKRLLEKVPKAP